MIELALTVVILGFASTGTVALARALPWNPKIRDAKPIGCIACMAGWCSLVMLVFATIAGYLVWRGWQGYVGGFVIWLAATGLSVYLLAQAGTFASDPFITLRDEVPPTTPPGAVTRAP